MPLKSREGIDQYISGIEDTCRLMRKNLMMELSMERDIEIVDPNKKNGDTAGFDMSDQSDETSLTETDFENDNLDPFAMKPQKRIGRPKIRNTSQKSDNGDKTTNHSGYQIRDWNSKFYQVLNGKQLTGIEVFNELHTAKLIAFKGSDQQKSMYKRFRKTLSRLQNDGIIEQVSDAHNAPWRWIGAAIMVGYRNHKVSQQESENEKQIED
jgi:hypothetical protein